MQHLLSGGLWLVPLAVLALVVPGQPAEAARPRGPSAAQIKKMREQMQYAQQEMLRYHNETAAKEREVYLSFDENGNGKLEGAEGHRSQPALRHRAARPGAHGGRQQEVTPPGTAASRKNRAKIVPVDGFLYAVAVAVTLPHPGLPAWPPPPPRK